MEPFRLESATGKKLHVDEMRVVVKPIPGHFDPVPGHFGRESFRPWVVSPQGYRLEFYFRGHKSPLILI